MRTKYVAFEIIAIFLYFLQIRLELFFQFNRCCYDGNNSLSNVTCVCKLSLHPIDTKPKRFPWCESIEYNRIKVHGEFSIGIVFISFHIIFKYCASSNGRRKVLNCKQRSKLKYLHFREEEFKTNLFVFIGDFSLKLELHVWLFMLKIVTQFLSSSRHCFFH